MNASLHATCWRSAVDVAHSLAWSQGVTPPALPCLLAVHARVSTHTANSLQPPDRPRFDGASTYVRDYGAAGSDPLSRAAASPQQQALTATTRELSSGTTRASPARPPGFTGFIPACKDNAAAVAHSLGAEPRPDAKALPLDAGRHTRVGRHGGYPHGPTAATTQGFNNLQVGCLNGRVVCCNTALACCAR